MGAVSKERPEPPSPPSKSTVSEDTKAADGRWKMPALPVLQAWEVSVLALTLLREFPPTVGAFWEDGEKQLSKGMRVASPLLSQFVSVAPRSRNFT